MPLISALRNLRASWRRLTLPRVPSAPATIVALCGWAVAALLALGFLHLGNEVGEGETVAFDVAVLVVAQGLRNAHPSLVDVMRDLSGAGSTTFLSLITTAACLHQLLFRAPRMAGLLASSVVAASLLVQWAKGSFGRLRPDLAFAAFPVPGHSFPSGHSSMSAVVLLCVAALLTRSMVNRRERIFIVGAAALLAALVGISRAMLGVHWATDVAAGWLFGVSWSAASVWVARRFAPLSSLDKASP